MIVVDASAVLELLIETETIGARVRERLSHESLHVPHLFDLEVLSALRRHERSGALASERAELAIARCAELPLLRYEHALLAPRIWALRDNLTPYDAAYLALAEALDAPLVTTDVKLQDVPGVQARVEVVR